MNIIKKNYQIIILSFFFFFYNLILCSINLDEIWSYGFAYNIYNGLIPYKDFNMVITPLHPFIMSLPMYIFGSNELLFHVENTIIIGLILYLLFKMIGKNTYFIIPFFIFPLNVIYPNYNVLILFLFILLIFLEKEKKNDYLIGFIIGLLFLTKQSVGLPILLTIFVTLDKNKIFKRLIGFIIPNIIFFIYLLLTKSLSSFIDLCFLGLIDFSNGNGTFNIVLLITIFFILISIIFIIKDNKNITYYYLVLFSSITVPLFDYYHFILFFISFLFIFILNNKIKVRLDIIGLVLFSIIILISIYKFNPNNKYPNNINHFEYRYFTKEYVINTNYVDKLINKYNNKVVIIGPDAYYHKIILDQKINNLDLLNKGNNGYNASSKIIKRIKELDKDYVFFINKNSIKGNTQIEPKVIKYIINHGREVEDTKFYSIYKIDK